MNEDRASSIWRYELVAGGVDGRDHVEKRFYEILENRYEPRLIPMGEGFFAYFGE